MLLLIFILILLASVFVPGAVIVILLLNIAAAIFVSASHIIVALFSHSAPRRKKIIDRPFVSIIVPAYNEPPAILMQTLESLSHLDYHRFEVLVIDNNTSDAFVWKPVEAFTRTLGEKFRFFHVERLSGFKAGALNYILQYTDRRSEYVAVIDADYVVRPNFLSTALSYFVGQDIALIQFPQSYRNCTSENQPIADEYYHFFKIFMNMANRLDCVPSTGTVSVYTLSALRKIGGFREQALTEDADAGLRIYGEGYRGVYVDTPIGYGLMPYDIEAYKKQKRRWAMGNAQSIKTLFLLYRKIPFRSWIGFFIHLTAWNHLNFFPLAVLAAYVIVVMPAVTTTELHKRLLDIAILSIFIVFASKLIIFLIALRGEKKSLSRSLKAFIVHIGMTLLYSEAWGALFFKTKPAFDRTNKFILEKMPSLLKNSYKELLLGTWFLFGAVVAIAGGSRVITIAAFIVSAASLFSIYYVYWKICPTKPYSKKILSDMEYKYQKYLSTSSNI